MSHFNLTGTTLGRFEVISELGRGGMALVYLARQTDLDRLVALKMLRPELSYDPDTVARFHHEARSAARLEHRHIVPIYDIGELEVQSGLRMPYIAMKYIAGGTLKDMLQLEGRLSLDRTLAIITQVVSALDYAHERGVVHRDVKPGNILIGSDDTIYLGDFGLAWVVGGTTRLTQTGMVLGTPEYMSPEQVQGQISIGPATDIYALGVVIYEMLTGAFPFEVDTPMATMVARLMQSPRSLSAVRSDIPPTVEIVITKALARDPMNRFSSAGEMLWTMRRALTGQGLGSSERGAASSRQGVRASASTGQTIALPQAAEGRQQEAASSGQGVRASANTGQTIALPQAAGIGEPPSAVPPSVGAEWREFQQGRQENQLLALHSASAIPPSPASVVADRHSQQRTASARNAIIPWYILKRIVSFPLFVAVLFIVVSTIIFALSGWFSSPTPTPVVVQPTLHGTTAELLDAGWKAFDSGMYTEAMRAFEMAANLDDTNAQAFYGKGRALAAQRKYDQALVEFRSALQRDSKNADYHAWMGEASLQRGIDSEQTGDNRAAELDYTQAEKSFTLANSLNKNDAFIQAGLGRTYFKRYNFQRAQAAFQASLNANERQPEVHNGLGWTLFELRDYPQARQHFERAIELDTGYANAFYGLGEALQALGRKDEARAAYESALEIDPDYTEVERALARLSLMK